MGNVFLSRELLKLMLLWLWLQNEAMLIECSMFIVNWSFAYSSSLYAVSNAISYMAVHRHKEAYYNFNTGYSFAYQPRRIKQTKRPAANNHWFGKFKPRVKVPTGEASRYLCSELQAI